MQKYVTFGEKDPPENSLKLKKYRKVRDYCYYAVKYKGAAHNTCNLRFNVFNELPVVFPNLWNWWSFYHKRITKRVWKTI